MTLDFSGSPNPACEIFSFKETGMDYFALPECELFVAIVTVES